MQTLDYANTRFSKLDQINAGNVGKLQVGALVELGGDGGQDHGPAPRRRRQAEQVWLTTYK